MSGEMTTYDADDAGNEAAAEPAANGTLSRLPAQPMTAIDCRTVEVNDALAPAYQRASTLEMTDEEVAALMERFPDEAVEIRPHDGLIYLPHIHISNRLNRVFKPGKWALIRRREWFANGIMYGEYVLLIRGCYVGESVGGHAYIATNPKTNYSDALESTAAEALRRIAGKRLSCGDQVWDPEYSRQWVARNAVRMGAKWQRRDKPAEEHHQETQQPKATPPPRLSEGQAKVIESLLETHVWNRAKLLQSYNAERIEDIPASEFARIQQFVSAAPLRGKSGSQAAKPADADDLARLETAKENAAGDPYRIEDIAKEHKIDLRKLSKSDVAFLIAELEKEAEVPF